MMLMKRITTIIAPTISMRSVLHVGPKEWVAMAMFERERERVSHLLSHFDLISSSKLAFDEKVTFDWMISLVLMLFVYGCLMSKWLYWPIATKSFVAISFKCTLLTYRNKKFCCNKFSEVFIATKIIVAIAYLNKNFVAINYNNNIFCCNKVFLILIKLFYCNKLNATKIYCNEIFVVIVYCHRFYRNNG